MPSFTPPTAVLTLALLLLLANPAHAFGAGNIASLSKIEGLNWRHGDIEDTLLSLVMARVAGGKKFDKMMVSRVYFGNWLRDYSQAIDVGTVKYVSAEAIRILLWVLGFMTFGYGTREFEVTADRLGCYRPEDHIDNPKDYADNLDASQYDRRLRGPVNNRVELAIDPRTGLKNYIANEQAGIMTSALHVRKLFGRCIQLGRSYGRSKNKDELYEALRLLGTGLHCLEDYSAHSNYTELALIEMGERDVFPHVGRQTQIRLQGAQHPVYPIVTGTFGGVDFLHSVMGEFDDKATQSELQGLESTMQSGGQADTSVLKGLLNSIPSGIFGDSDQAGKADKIQADAVAAQMSQTHVSPRQPEQFTRQMQQVAKEIYPIIQWHDETMQKIREAIEKIPVLPALIENIQDQINIFVFSLLAPLILPIINQIKTELNTGSSEIIQSSKDKQWIVFSDDHCSDPTHSMLSKDHFSNILNEPAGKVASQVIKWVVPQLMECWDNERTDVDRTINRIINGVFHHPTLRNQGDDGASDGRRLMFGVVEQWWRGMDPREQQEYRRKLSRDGVQNGENHKEGVHDNGHGCGKPLSMPNQGNKGISDAGPAGAIVGGLTSALGSLGGGGSSGGNSSGVGQFAEEAVGGGPLGGIVGALAGGIGGSLLGGVLGGSNEPETKAYASEGYTSQGGYQKNYTEVSHGGNQYGQSQYSSTQLPSGGRQTEYQEYRQSGSGQEGYGYDQRTTTQPAYGGGYDQTTERVYERTSGGVEVEAWREEGRTTHHEPKHHESRHHRGNDSDSSNDERKKKHHHKKHSNDYGNDRPQQYQPQSQTTSSYGASGYGQREERFQEPSRQEYGGAAAYQQREERFQEPSRQEYGGAYQQREERFQEPAPPAREEYGGGAGYGGGYEQRQERFQEPAREEYGSGGGYGREEYGGGGGAAYENRGAYGQERTEGYEAEGEYNNRPRRDNEYTEEKREGWFS